MKLSDITKNSQIKPPRVLIFGPAGIGKTTFGAAAPRPIFLTIEDGLGKIEANAFPQPKNYLEARSALDALINEDHDYKTLVVDSLDWLEPLIWAHTCDQNKWQSIEAPGYGRGYVEALKYWREFLDRVNYLRDHKKMATVLICHSTVKRFEAPDAEAFDRYVLKLQAKASDLVAEHSDAIFFANQVVNTIKTEDRGRVRTRGTGKGDRVMYTEERPAWIAKNRYGLPSEMPLDWKTFQQQLAGDQNNV
jgi:hypothetical protein